jgi:hypothetical protein
VRSGRGASVSRSPCWGGSEDRRADKVNYRFGLTRRGQLLIFPIKLTLRRGGHRLEESGGPPLFEPSLKVEGNSTHNHSRFEITKRAFRSRVDCNGHKCVANKNRSDFQPVLESDHTKLSRRNQRGCQFDGGNRPAVGARPRPNARERPSQSRGEAARADSRRAPYLGGCKSP